MSAIASQPLASTPLVGLPCAWRPSAILEAQISSGQRDAREKLLDNFDQEVVEKVRVDSSAMLDRFNDQLWRLTRHVLAGHASFADDGFGFTLHTNPFPGIRRGHPRHRPAEGRAAR
jgi:hypothetical protein